MLSPQVKAPTTRGTQVPNKVTLNPQGQWGKSKEQYLSCELTSFAWGKIIGQLHMPLL